MTGTSEAAWRPDFEALAAEMVSSARASSTEEDLRIRIESLLKNRVLDPLGLDWGQYELSARAPSTLINGVRIDALHAHVVIEYERPGSLDRMPVYEHAVDQAKNGIIAHAKGETTRYSKYLGVVTDGLKIGFVRYSPARGEFEYPKSPEDVETASVSRFVEAIHGLSRKALDAPQLVKEFGPGSGVSVEVIGALYDKISGLTTARTAVLFGDWRRVFSQVCAYDAKKLRGLGEEYLPNARGIDPERLLFALHTYFALLMKLIVAEVTSLTWEGMGSFLVKLEDSRVRGSKGFRAELDALEGGSIFQSLGLSNFVEGDYFSWYLSEWDQDLSDALGGLIRGLYSYDPTTASIEPDLTRDLFKQLYQKLVPGKVRHDLGEFYTPDWLAEIVLDEVGITQSEFDLLSKGSGDPVSPLRRRVLDPACGSGTFLVLTLGRYRRYIKEASLDRREALHLILKNVSGYDLNPLAVLASRANYLIALGDLLLARGADEIEIPVYFADSVLTERRVSLEGSQLYALRTEAGDFTVPTEVVKSGDLGRVLGILEQCLKMKYSSSEAASRIRQELALQGATIRTIASLYSRLKVLEREKRDGIWLRILRNSFAPLLAERFDFVVGNPPWVHWVNLPEKYRKASVEVWDRYELLSSKKSGGRVAIGKKAADLSSLFTLVSIDRYLKEGGTLGFLVPQSLFKSTASESFRTSLERREIRRIHDLVELSPFEGAHNRTGLIVVRRDGPTRWPVPYVVWTSKDDLPGFSEGLAAVLPGLQMTTLEARPVAGTGSPWLSSSAASNVALRKVLGHSEYTAHKGIVFSVIGAFWVNINQVDSKHSRVANLVGGKSKVKVDEREGWIENRVLFPLLRGKDVSRWKAHPQLSAIVVHDRKDGEVLDRRTVKVELPKTFEWFHEFEKAIQAVKAQPYGPAFRNGDQPPWWLFNVTAEFFAPYKVVWKYISADFTAAVVEPFNGAPILPYEKLMFVKCNSRDEALYLCAILNSTLVREFVRSYAISSQLSTHILERLKVSRFDPASRKHMALVGLAAKLSDPATPSETVLALETELDLEVNRMYDLSTAEAESLTTRTPAPEGARGDTAR
jgi:hypothetical protein